MKNNVIIRIFSIVCVLVIVLCLFLPFFSYESTASSLFALNEELNYVAYIILGFSLISIVTLIFNKKVELCYMLVGSSLTYCIMNTISFIDSFSFFGYGYYLLSLSTFLLFLALIILGFDKMKADKIVKVSDDKKEDNNESFVNVPSKVDTNIENDVPNDLAMSIMNQPVMSNTEENTSLLDNNSDFLKNDNLNSELDNNLDLAENVTLAPQNPLNSFLPSDFDPSKIVKEENNDNNNEESIDNSAETTVENENSGQSIMSVMSQPMVNSSVNYSNNMDVNNNVIDSNQTVMLNQIDSQPVIDSNMVQPEISSQPVIDSNIVQPEISSQPVIDSNMVQPEISGQPVIEPDIFNN